MFRSMGDYRETTCCSGRPSGPGLGRSGRWCHERASRPSAGGFVLPRNARGDAPAVTDRDALPFRPRPDITAALTACRGAPGPAAWSPPGLARVVDEQSDLPAERRGVLLAQIDLVLRAVQPEPHRLRRRAPIKIVFQRDRYLLRHRGLPECDRLPAPYKINRHAAAAATPPVARPPPWTYPPVRVVLATGTADVSGLPAKRL